MSIKRIVDRNLRILGSAVPGFYKIFVCISFLLLVSRLLFGELAFSLPKVQPIAPQDFYTWCLGTIAGTNPPIKGVIIEQILMDMRPSELSEINSKTCKIIQEALLKLTKLDLRPTTFAGNSFNDLPPEERLIIDLQPIASLTHLKELNLAGNFLIHDLKPLASLTKLQVLGLADNKITDITPLSKLKELRKLDLSNNKITDITPLSKLKKLRKLDLSNNKITDILPLQELQNLQKVLLSGNDLLSLNCPLKIKFSCQFMDK
ncbi:leucine-rich repeat domain-containing protein [Microcoleus sp. Pol11C3]|uniref:leucine-rich repeat domain-containing protein n=1 Tax=Microcoleus sp. Pol11C3 TaxID=3055390 RepID=UPI002FD4875F